MNKKEKIKFIIDTLNKYFPSPQIPLNHTTPFTLLIAVLLSAQTTDIRVNKITKILFKKADTPEKMITLPIEEITEIVKTCGLGPTKARAILKLSHILIEEYDSIVPDNFIDLEKLPGVGHKTAGVVMGQAFNKYAFPVDTHVMRLARRFGLSKEKTPIKIENDLKKIFPKKLWKILHLQIIYFGRSYCKALGHKKENCPICKAL